MAVGGSQSSKHEQFRLFIELTIILFYLTQQINVLEFSLNFASEGPKLQLNVSTIQLYASFNIERLVKD